MRVDGFADAPWLFLMGSVTRSEFPRPSSGRAGHLLPGERGNPGRVFGRGSFREIQRPSKQAFQASFSRGEKGIQGVSSDAARSAKSNDLQNRRFKHPSPGGRRWPQAG